MKKRCLEGDVESLYDEIYDIKGDIVKIENTIEHMLNALNIIEEALDSLGGKKETSKVNPTVGKIVEGKFKHLSKVIPETEGIL